MNKKIAYIGVFSAFAIILGYVESLIPVFVGIPGVKLGLANIAVIGVLYLFGFWEALAVSVIRVVMIGFLFGNLYSILYGLSGAVFSLLVMMLLKKSRFFSILAVSCAGGVAHNVAQIAVAAIVVSTYSIWYYLPVILLSGVLTGALIGLLGGIITNRVEGQFHS